MDTKKLYLFNFCYGVINSIAIQMLPLVLVDKGYDASRVTIVLSFVFLASIFQPAIGILTKTKTGSKRMIHYLLVTLGLLSLAIFATTNFLLMILSVLIFSISRLSLSPIYDSVVTLSAKNHGTNYGLVRSGASLGFGTGMGIYTIVSSVFNWSYQMAFVFIVLIAIIGYFLVNRLPEETQIDTNNAKSDEKNHIFKYILLVAIYTLYFGGINLRISYISTYYIEFGYSTAFISLAAFAMVIPEVIFLPLYNRLFSKYNKVLLLVVTLVLGIIQLFLYTVFTAKPIFLLIISMINGFQIMLFFPTFFGLLQHSLNERNSALGFIINTTVMSLSVGFFNAFVIRPLYVGSGTTIPIFYAIIGLNVIALVPLFIYNIKFYRN